MLSKISKVFTHVIEVPLSVKWKTALYSTTTRRHAVVEVVTEDGIHGFGEASPSPAFMGETADTIKLTVDKYLSPVVEGFRISDLASIHDMMNKAIYSHSAAKSAIDIAVHDAWAKTMKVPLFELLGGAYRKEIPLAYSIGMKEIKDSYQEALNYIDQGFAVIKVKVGADPSKDISLVNLIRKAIDDSGKEVRIRLDANQGYDVRTAIKVIRELEEHGDLESVEQPVEKWNVFGLKQIRENIKTPIMIDETVFSPQEAMNAIKMDIADIINLKICKVGGIYQAKKIAFMAEAAGMSCAVGSNLELGIGIAASLHFVASTPVVQHPSDFIAGIYLHEHDIIETPMKSLVKNGRLSLLNDIGLGVNMVQDLIEKIR